jgi:hypothetical protein
MRTINIKTALLSIFVLFAVVAESSAFASKGIYLTQYTLENTSYLNYLIRRAKASGIDTFIIDMEKPSSRYRNNVARVKESGIKYIARVVMFEGGANPSQVNNPAIWQSRYKLVKQAVDWGADSIQLDYIRYNTKQPPSAENAKKILNIIQWYKTKLAAENIPLQIDVFGETSFGASKWIGQDAKLFSQSIDALCPMVYPSHYKPFDKHYRTPYDTVYGSLTRMKGQFGGTMPVKLYPYIELSNYHYSMTKDQKLKYIREQIKATKDAGADGFYVWSAHNRYDNLFDVLGG